MKYCNKIKLENVRAKGDYFGMNSENINIEKFSLVGNYAFDGGKNIEIHNVKILSKDAFWNCENIINPISGVIKLLRDV